MPHYYKARDAHKGQFPQDGENGQNVAFSFIFFFSYAVTEQFDFFQLFSTVLKRLWPGHANNVFVLVLAHLKPELELFEVDDVGDDGDGQNPFLTAEKSWKKNQKVSHSHILTIFPVLGKLTHKYQIYTIFSSTAQWYRC